MLLFTGTHLTEQAFRAVADLCKKRLFVPAAVYFADSTLEQAYAAGRLHRHRVEPIFGPAQLGAGVTRLLERAVPVVRSGVVYTLGVADGLGERLLALLDRDPAMLTATPNDLARELGISRSGLYRGLRAARLPPPGAFQALFRLWPGMLRIAVGGRGDDAEFEAGCPHYLAFRRAVATHFRLTIREIRELADSPALLRRWAIHQTRHQPRHQGPQAGMVEPGAPPSMVATRARRIRGSAGVGAVWIELR